MNQPDPAYALHDSITAAWLVVTGLLVALICGLLFQRFVLAVLEIAGA